MCQDRAMFCSIRFEELDHIFCEVDKKVFFKFPITLQIKSLKPLVRIYFYC
jgi:hypothetical protein